MTSPLTYTESFRVPFGDTDAAGVVFYPNYYRWFDRMTHELFRHVDEPLEKYLRQGEAPVLVESGCTYLRSLRYDDVVALEARMVEIGDRKLRIEHVVRVGGDPAANAFEVRLWVHFEGREVGARWIPRAVKLAFTGEA